MSSEVYFAQRRATQGGGLLDKLEQLCDAAGFASLVGAGELVAVKLAYGEVGNTTLLRPQYLQRVVRKLQQYGGRPFLADTLPAQPSRRANAIDQLLAASRHGYDAGVVDAPVVVADGLLGRDEALLPAPGQHLGEARIASALAQAEALMSVCHFTGNDLTGFSGALWNMGFGAASLAGKAQILAAGNGESDADGNQAVQERMVETLAALLQTKPKRVGYVNILVDLTPESDNQAFSDAAVVPDIGILASRDPVALDQASVDLFNQTPGIPGTRLAEPTSKDKLRDLHPEVDWELQLRYAESLGLGTRDYELMII
jgi:hypothetical protein